MHGLDLNSEFARVKSGRKKTARRFCHLFIRYHGCFVKRLIYAGNNQILKKFPVGEQVTGSVTNVADYGAFVKLDEGIEGLIYSSELSTERVDDPNEVVKAGDEVTALVTRVDPMEQKISLSIRALSDKEQRQELKKLAAQQAATQTTTIGDLLQKKLAEQADGEEEE